MSETRASLVESSDFTPFLKKMTIFASGGVFLDGYILVIIGIALVQLGPKLALDAYWSGLAGAASLVGLLFGALIFGYLTDIIGRKAMYLIDLAAIIVFSILSAFISSPVQLVLLRFGIGLAIGADYPISTSLLAEFTPTKHRGFMMGLMMIVWYIGAIVCSFVGYFLLALPNGWAWMLASAAIPAAILIIGRWDTPESPRWLLKAGKTEQALKVVKKVWGEQAELSDLGEAPPKKTNWLKTFQKGYFRRLVFVGIFWMCQVIPCFAIYTFGPQILGAFGMAEGNSWIWGYTIINVAFTLGCIPGLYWVESMGRRRMLILSYVIMSIGLLMLGVVPVTPVPVVLLGFGLYAFFSGPPTVLDALYPNELFPTDIRASAYGVATAISRIGAAVGTFALPVVLKAYGIQVTMLIATAITVLGLVVSIFMAPETKGKTLVECASLDWEM